jgi:Flp pilus assembly protein TadG
MHPPVKRHNGTCGNESGVTLLVGIVSLLFIIPMVGLSIDTGILYAVKSRLQAAVDGASLAAARALSLGSTTDAQSASAKQNAVNWFYANFSNGNWGTSGTSMNTSSVNVFDDPHNAHLRNVTVTASTNAPTYFMKWLGFNSVTVSASGNASRRDVVVMMVLDRSGSMQTAGVCGNMRTSAKIFTGQFAAGRDMIGLVSFSDNVTIHHAPSTDFQTQLGYTNSSGSGTGAIDTITCSGGTSTAQAISVAYNEIYKVNLPGALNVIMFETDGLPNTLTLSFWDGSRAGLASSSPCTDKNTKTIATGFKTTASLPAWAGVPSLGTGSYFTLQNYLVAGIYTADPSQSHTFDLANNYWSSNSYISSSSTPNCYFNSYHSSTSDFAWWPAKDLWGNSLSPATNPYKTVTSDGSGHISNGSSWLNFHNAALNAADNAAYRARTNATIGVYFFGIGLGGSGTDTPDYILMQRMTNDPNPDNFNSPAKYQACASETGCVTYSNQNQGTFVFSSDASDLSRAFLSISSQILRLSK